MHSQIGGWVSSGKTKIEAGLKKIHTHECRLRDITDSMKRSNVRIIGIPERVEKNRGLDVFEQIVAENFPRLARETSIRVQEAERTPSKLNHNKPTPHHVIVKFANIRSKDTVLKVPGQRNFSCTKAKLSELRQTCLQRPGMRERLGGAFLKLFQRKTCSQGSFIQQGCHSELMER